MLARNNSKARPHRTHARISNYHTPTVFMLISYGYVIYYEYKYSS